MVITNDAVAYDDSQLYKQAKFYKKKAQKAIDKSSTSYNGECRVMLTMTHQDNQYAKLKRIRTSGNRQLCQLVKKELKRFKNKKVAYSTPEKFLRITLRDKG